MPWYLSGYLSSVCLTLVVLGLSTLLFGFQILEWITNRLLLPQLQIVNQDLEVNIGSVSFHSFYWDYIVSKFSHNSSSIGKVHLSSLHLKCHRKYDVQHAIDAATMQDLDLQLFQRLCFWFRWLDYQIDEIHVCYSEWHLQIPTSTLSCSSSPISSPHSYRWSLKFSDEIQIYSTTKDPLLKPKTIQLAHLQADLDVAFQSSTPPSISIEGQNSQLSLEQHEIEYCLSILHKILINIQNKSSISMLKSCSDVPLSIRFHLHQLQLNLLPLLSCRIKSLSFANTPANDDRNPGAKCSLTTLDIFETSTIYKRHKTGHKSKEDNDEHTIISMNEMDWTGFWRNQLAEEVGSSPSQRVIEMNGSLKKIFLDLSYEERFYPRVFQFAQSLMDSPLFSLFHPPSSDLPLQKSLDAWHDRFQCQKIIVYMKSKANQAAIQAGIIQSSSTRPSSFELIFESINVSFKNKSTFEATIQKLLCCPLSIHQDCILASPRVFWSFQHLRFHNHMLDTAITPIRNGSPVIQCSATKVYLKWSAEYVLAFGELIVAVIEWVGTIAKLRDSFEWIDNEPVWENCMDSHIAPIRSIEQMKQLVISNTIFRGQIQHVQVDIPVSHILSTSSTGKQVIQMEVINIEQITVKVLSTDSPNISSKWNLAFEQIRLSSLINGNDTNGNEDVQVQPCYCLIRDFIVEETKFQDCPKSIVDFVANQIEVHWTPVLQIRLMEIIQEITYTVWQNLFQVFDEYARQLCSSKHCLNVGVNQSFSNLDEFHRYQNQFKVNISASGDKLHRLRFSNLLIHGHLKSPEASNHTNNIKIHVECFEGLDLPDLWKIQHLKVILFDGHPIVTMDQLEIRRTLEAQRDYVYGDWEMNLRQREAVISFYKTGTIQPTPEAGFLFQAQVLDILIPHQIREFRYCMKEIEEEILSMINVLQQQVKPYWRPQADIFYRYFLYHPSSSPLAAVIEQHHRSISFWCEWKELNIEIQNSPMEVWLENMYPIWLDELAQQHVQHHILSTQKQMYQTTNINLLREQVDSEMEELLLKKQATLYIQRIRDLALKRTGPLLQIRLNQLSMTLVDATSTTTPDLVYELDEASQTQSFQHSFELLEQEIPSSTEWTPQYQFLQHLRIEVETDRMEVHLCQFPKPFVAMTGLKCQVELIMLQTASFDVDNVFNTPTNSHRSFIPVKIFGDVQGQVNEFDFIYAPSYEFALEQLAIVTQQLDCIPVHCPIESQCDLPFWDIVRRRVHGRVDVHFGRTSIRLLSSLTTFEVDEYFELQIESGGRIGIQNLTHIQASASTISCRIYPGPVVPLIQAGHVDAEMKIKWAKEEDVMMMNHYLYPLKYRSKEGHVAYIAFLDDQVCRRILPTTTTITLTKHVETSLHQYHSKEFFLTLKASLDGNKPNQPLSVMVYLSSLPWLMRWAQIYQTIPPVPLPKKKMDIVEKCRRNWLLNHLSCIHVENIVIHPCDVILYLNEDSPMGVRFSIAQKMMFSAWFSNELVLPSTINTPALNAVDSTSTTTRKMRIGDISSSKILLPMNSRRIWSLHDTCFFIDQVQARICTKHSGSRGRFFFSIDRLCFTQEPTNRCPITSKSGQFFQSHEIQSFLQHEFVAPVHYSNPLSEFSNDHDEQQQKTATSTSTMFELFNISTTNHRNHHDDDVKDIEGSHSKRKLRTSDMVISNPRIEEIGRNESNRFLLYFHVIGIKILLNIETLEALMDLIDTMSIMWWNIFAQYYDCPSQIMAQTIVMSTFSPLSSATKSSSNAPRSRPKHKTTKGKTLAEDPRFASILLESANKAGMDFRPPSSPQKDQDRMQTCWVNTFALICIDFQLTLRDDQNQGCTLFAIESCIIEGSSCTTKDDAKERIEIKGDRFQQFVFPSNIDIMSESLWLESHLVYDSHQSLAYRRLFSFSKSLSLPTISPVPFSVEIGIDHGNGTSTTHQLRFQLEPVQVQMNMSEGLIFCKVIQAFVQSIAVKIDDKESKKQTIMLRNLLFSEQSKEYDPDRTIQDVYQMKQRLEWKLQYMHWLSERMQDEDLATWTTSAGSPRGGLAVAPLELHSNTFVLIDSIDPSELSIEHLDQTIEQWSHQFDSLCHVLRSMIKEATSRLSAVPNIHIDVYVDQLTLRWHQLVELRLMSVEMTLRRFEDQSGSCRIKVQDIQALNLCIELGPGDESYVDLLKIRHPQHSCSIPALQLDMDVASPVGGISIVQHLESNLSPFSIAITQDFISQVHALVCVMMLEMTSSTTSSSVTSKNASLAMEGVHLPSRRRQSQQQHAQHRQERHMREQFSATPTFSSSKSKFDVSGLFRSAKAKLRKPVGIVGRKGTESPQKQVQDLKQHDDSCDQEPQSHHRPAEPVRVEKEEEDVIQEMRERADANITFKHIRMGEMNCHLHYQSSTLSNAANNGPRIEDICGFHFKIHPVVYSNKTCSTKEMALRIRRDIIIDLLSQVGRNFQNLGHLLWDRWSSSPNLAVKPSEVVFQLEMPKPTSGFQTFLESMKTAKREEEQLERTHVQK